MTIDVDALPAWPNEYRKLVSAPAILDSAALISAQRDALRECARIMSLQGEPPEDHKAESDRRKYAAIAEARRLGDG